MWKVNSSVLLLNFWKIRARLETLISCIYLKLNMYICLYSIYMYNIHVVHICTPCTWTSRMQESLPDMNHSPMKESPGEVAVCKHLTWQSQDPDPWDWIVDLPGTLNNHFLIDVWWNNHFLCNDLESSSWNNHKKLVVWTSRCITVGDKMATLKKRGKCFRTVKIFPILPWIHVGNGKTVKSWWLVPTWKICARRKLSNGSEFPSK